MDRLESFGHLRDVDKEKRRVKAVISTGDVARDDAIIDPEGWDFTNYDRNPVVLWMHQDGAMPFARTVERMATSKELIAVAEFDAEDEFGMRVFNKIASGYVNATSVRWLPIRTELITEGSGKDEHSVLVFREQELLEWSFVTIPADPKALIVRADGGEFSARDYIPKRGPMAVASDFSWLRGLDSLALLLPKPTNGHHNGHNRDERLETLERLLVQHFEQRQRYNVDELLVSALSKATGRTEERIRAELARGGK